MEEPLVATKGHFLSIRLKFILMYTFVMVFIIAFLALLIGIKSATMLKEKVKISCNQELSFSNERLTGLTQRLTGEVMSLTYSQAGIEESLSGLQERLEEYERSYRISENLLNFLENHPEAASVTFYQNNGEAFYRDSHRMLVHKSVPWEVREFLARTDNFAWITGSPLQQKFLYLKKVYSFDGVFIGCFSIALTPAVIAETFGSASSNPMTFYLLNRDGTVCFSTQQTPLDKLPPPLLEYIGRATQTSEVFSVDARGVLYTVIPSVIPSICMMAAVPNSYIYQDAGQLALTITLVGLLFMALSYWLFNWLTNRIIRPLNSVLKMMRIISDGDFSARIPVVCNDEVGRLAVQINLIAHNTQLLMRDIHLEEEQKRKYELSYQQVQMQPHFLYNTLETICGMIEMDDHQGAITLINDISRFYRGVLNRGEPIITLKQELDITQYYLKIMQKRYCNGFSYSICVEQSMLEERIPKLILQPLVENAIVHGIVECGYHGEIAITGYREGEWLHLQVADNGKGITPEKWALLEQRIHDEKKERLSFGANSIKKRLRLYMGESVEVLFGKNEPCGVQVEIQFLSKNRVSLEAEKG